MRSVETCVSELTQRCAELEALVASHENSACAECGVRKHLHAKVCFACELTEHRAQTRAYAQELETARRAKAGAR